MSPRRAGRLPVVLSAALALALALACSSAAPTTSTPGGSSQQFNDVVRWVDQTAAPLTSVEPTASDTDLTPLLAMVGNARVIGLGTAAYGSHEFTTATDRVLRFLVERAGVTAFALEASMPETFALDTYVRTGVGNPAVLLSHLYVWRWNTEELTNLVAWLRSYNIAHPDKQVGFYGFDMQWPGIAIDSVMSYVTRVASPTLMSAVQQDYACATPYRNNDHGVFQASYLTAGAPCTSALQDVGAQLLSQRDSLVAASSPAEFELALRMARVVLQWEVYVRVIWPGYPIKRDSALADNVQWLLQREGPSGKLLLLGHTSEISRQPTNGVLLTMPFGALDHPPTSMGTLLAAQLGTSYVALGFVFGSGGFNATEQLTNGASGSLRSFPTPAEAGSYSYEEAFQLAKAKNFLLDLRQASGDVQAWLAGPRPVRAIAALYVQSRPELYFGLAALPAQFDGVIYINLITPSGLLPFTY